jgi:hypothetical protein
LIDNPASCNLSGLTRRQSMRNGATRPGSQRSTRKARHGVDRPLLDIWSSTRTGTWITGCKTACQMAHPERFPSCLAEAAANARCVANCFELRRLANLLEHGVFTVPRAVGDAKSTKAGLRNVAIFIANGW